MRVIMPILKIAYPKYPKMVEMVATRDIHDQEEAAGRAFVIRPKNPVDVSRIVQQGKNSLYDDYQDR